MQDGRVPVALGPLFLFHEQPSLCEAVAVLQVRRRPADCGEVVPLPVPGFRGGGVEAAAVGEEAERKTPVTGRGYGGEAGDPYGT